jgi:cytochrome c2
MPGFPAYARGLAQGFAMEHGFTPASPTRAAVDVELAKAGEALARKGALACMDCHSVGAQEALAGADTVTINFAWIPERLNKHYFDRYLLDPQHVLPGTMMPKFSDDSGKTGATSWFEGDAKKQFEAVWNFMRTVPAPVK